MSYLHIPTVPCLESASKIKWNRKQLTCLCIFNLHQKIAFAVKPSGTLHRYLCVQSGHSEAAKKRQLRRGAAPRRQSIFHPSLGTLHG